MNETYRKMFLSYANASLSDPGQLAIGEIVYARRLLIIYEEKASKLLNMEQMAINRTPHSLNDSLLSTAEIIFLGHKISSEGVGPDPGNVQAIKEMPMSQNVSQLRSLLGALSYYGRPLPKMAAQIQPLNFLFRRGVKFEFSSHHERIV